MKTKTSKKRDTWYKLDLSANVYPTLQRKNFSSVYRISITLKETIQADLLQKAVDSRDSRPSRRRFARAFSGVTSNRTTARVPSSSRIFRIRACT